jgi:hypothetical protein
MKGRVARPVGSVGAAWVLLSSAGALGLTLGALAEPGFQESVLSATGRPGWLVGPFDRLAAIWDVVGPFPLVLGVAAGLALAARPVQRLLWPDAPRAGWASIALGLAVSLGIVVSGVVILGLAAIAMGMAGATVLAVSAAGGPGEPPLWWTMGGDAVGFAVTGLVCIASVSLGVAGAWLVWDRQRRTPSASALAAAVAVTSALLLWAALVVWLVFLVSTSGDNSAFYSTLGMGYLVLVPGMAMGPAVVVARPWSRSGEGSVEQALQPDAFRASA